MFYAERKDIISVIIYVYNYKNIQNPHKLMAVLKSIRGQNSDIEIVLSEQGFSKESPYKQIANELNIKYVLSKPDLVDGKVKYNIGRVRNVGALISSGRYLYFSDADILIFNANYFKTILDKSCSTNNYNWYRPSMYRLSETTSGEFAKDYIEGKRAFTFCSSDVCMVDYDSSLLTFKSILGGECNGELISQPFVCTKEEFDMINSEGFDPEKKEELIWKARFHYGGTFCSFENFIAVAGYCEVFYDYGCEDGDFQYKLKSKSGIEKIDSIVTDKSIIHFEHCRKYNNQTFKENQDINSKRRNEWIDKIIEFDINKERSFIGSYIKKDMDTIKSFLIES